MYTYISYFQNINIPKLCNMKFIFCIQQNNYCVNLQKINI